MTLWAALPLRGFALGKSRLAARLDGSARDALNRWLFAHTVACAAGALGAGRVLVVSPDPAVIDQAHALGLAAVREPADAGLNGALTVACAAAARRGATSLFSLSCDLPLLTPADVTAALDAWPGAGTMLLVPDQAGSGTNGLIIPIGSGFVYRMGQGSAQRHRETAAAVGFGIAECRRPGLAFDLDTPTDLMCWHDATGVAA